LKKRGEIQKYITQAIVGENNSENIKFQTKSGFNNVKSQKAPKI
jgi:hypothetical protein